MSWVMPRWCLMLAVVVAVAGCGGQVVDGTLTPTADVTVPRPTVTAAVTPTSSTPSIATVGLIPDPGCTAEGGVVGVAVTVTHVSDLYGVELHLAFDASRLQVVDADPATPGVQIEDGTLLKVGFTPVNQADNKAGRIDYAVAQMPPTTPATGDGVLAQIRFKTLTSGAAAVTLESALFAASDGHALPIRSEPMTVTVLIP